MENGHFYLGIALYPEGRTEITILLLILILIVVAAIKIHKNSQNI